jgi:glycosyltransferase involved in cell wall biosynthesis
MRILQVHNYYQQPGGEDQVVATEAAFLRARGHSVGQYTMHNDQIGPTGRLQLAGKTMWNQRAYTDLRAAVRSTGAALMHVHNTVPLISPAAYYAAKREGIPVVQTLHNYRLLCPAGTMYRDGQVCSLCVNKAFAWPAIVKACYRGSAGASGVLAGMLTAHRLIGTWANRVSRYVALTDFARDQFIQGGIPADKIVVKPNCLAYDPGVGSGEGRYALFVGRLSPEKGIGTLLEAFKLLGGVVPLKVVGMGPLESALPSKYSGLNSVQWLGQVAHAEVVSLMKAATMLIFPSEWYECLPMTIVEAYAVGLPVIGSDLGSTGTLVRDGKTGLLFRTADAADLAAKVEWAWTHDEEMRIMRLEARAEFERYYTAEANYEQLLRVYELAARG